MKKDDIRNLSDDALDDALGRNPTGNTKTRLEQERSGRRDSADQADRDSKHNSRMRMMGLGILAAIAIAIYTVYFG